MVTRWAWRSQRVGYGDGGARRRWPPGRTASTARREAGPDRCAVRARIVLAWRGPRGGRRFRARSAAARPNNQPGRPVALDARRHAAPAGRSTGPSSETRCSSPVRAAWGRASRTRDRHRRHAQSREAAERLAVHDLDLVAAGSSRRGRPFAQRGRRAVLVIGMHSGRAIGARPRSAPPMVTGRDRAVGSGRRRRDRARSASRTANRTGRERHHVLA